MTAPCHRRTARLGLGHAGRSEGVVDARVSPLGSLENLSQREVQQLLSSGQGGVYELFRRCALAVLSSGLESDDVRAIFDRYKDFEIRLGRQAWGIKLEVKQRAGQRVRRRLR